MMNERISTEYTVYGMDREDEMKAKLPRIRELLSVSAGCKVITRKFYLGPRVNKNAATTRKADARAFKIAWYKVQTVQRDYRGKLRPWAKLAGYL